MIELNRVHNMRCHDMFGQLEEQAALIIADPPYGVKYNSSHKEGMSMRSARQKKPSLALKPRVEVERFDDTTIDLDWILLAYNALKDGGAMYLFTRWDVLHTWSEAAQKAGFKVVQRIVWDKNMMGMGDLRYYGSQTEDILFCVKGVHELRWGQREGNVWKYARGQMLNSDLSGEGGYRHPTQKPTRMMAKIIQYSSDPHDLIIDPFSGSGAACIAAQRLNRRFIGCDISPTFTDAANQWLIDDRNKSSQTRMTAMF